MSASGIMNFPHPNQTSLTYDTRDKQPRIYTLPSSAEMCQKPEFCGIHRGPILTSFSYNMARSTGQIEGTHRRWELGERHESVLLSTSSATVQFSTIPNQEHENTDTTNGVHNQEITMDGDGSTFSKHAWLYNLVWFLIVTALIIFYPLIILIIIVIFSLYMTLAILHAVLRRRDGHNIGKYFTICKYMLESIFKQSRDKLYKWFYFCDRHYECQGCNDCLNAVEFVMLYFVLGIVSILSIVCATVLLIVCLVPVLALICVLNMCVSSPSDNR